MSGAHITVFSHGAVAATPTPPPVTLGQVQGLRVGHPYMEIGLSWSALTGATSYHIEYKLHGTTTWLTGPVVKAPQVSVTVHNLIPGQTYDFRVYGVA